jgi:hypothetical protein
MFGCGSRRKGVHFFKKHCSLGEASIVTDFLARYERRSRSSVSTAWIYRNCLLPKTVQVR